MKYIITYNYDDWNNDDYVGTVYIDSYNDINEVNKAIHNIKSGLYDDGEYQRNIKVYKAEEITDEFDTKTKYDDDI